MLSLILANMLGIMVAMLLSPALVNAQNDLLLMNCVMLIPAVVVTVLSTVGVRGSTPSKPPSASAAQDSLPFWTGFKLLFRKESIAFWILAFCLGGCVALFNVLYTLMQPILCTKGYDDEFVGYCGAALMSGGIIGAVLSGIFVDRTKLFEETAKVCYCLAAIVACAMSVVVVRSNVEPAIICLMGMYGMFGFALYPIGLEMGVETTYPVAEATSSGIIILFDQLLGSLFVLFLGKMAGDPSATDLLVEKCRKTQDTETSSVEVQNWTYPVLIWVIISCFFAVMMTLLFRPKYKRIQAENIKKNILRNECSADTNSLLVTVSTVSSILPA